MFIRSISKRNKTAICSTIQKVRVLGKKLLSIYFIILLYFHKTSIQEGHIKFFKSDNKDLYNVTKDFQFINIKYHNCFQQICILEWFLKDHVALKTNDDNKKTLPTHVEKFKISKTLKYSYLK